MRILFDQGTPMPLRRYLVGYTVQTAFECGWFSLENGALLDAAEQAGFGLFITTDRNLKYQQNLEERQIAILVILSTSWPRIQLKITDIQAAVGAVAPGSYVEIPI